MLRDIISCYVIFFKSLSSRVFKWQPLSHYYWNTPRNLRGRGRGFNSRRRIVLGGWLLLAILGKGSQRIVYVLVTKTALVFLVVEK